MEVYLSSENSIEAVAQKVRDLFDLATVNTTSYQQDQKRESVNYGGTYYLLESGDVLFTVVRNSGEAQIKERREYNYYIIVEGPSEIISEASQRLLNGFRADRVSAIADDLS